MFKIYHKNIKYLVGNSKIEPCILKPFDKIVCDFLIELSNQILKNKESRKYSDLIALSYWCNKKKIDKLKKDNEKNIIRIGRGVVFHIAPSNIPTNFFYSLVFGLITGNSNIVKVPSNNFQQIKIICKEINNILKKKKYFLLKKNITIIKYQVNDINSITEEISKKCDIRIIWGGDETINSIRKFKIKPKATDITFSDRSSLCLLNAKKITNLKQKKIFQLASNFYNDTYSTDQNACSSPHIIFWLGKKNTAYARRKFWDQVYKIALKKYTLPDLAPIEKYSQFCKDLINNKKFSKDTTFSPYLCKINLEKLDHNLSNIRGKCGYFYEYCLDDLKEIKNFITSKFQTLTYFGFNKNFFNTFFLNHNINGIDRVVPVGEGLNIELQWDGYDIISSLSRIVSVK
jgi:hypothetical protein